MVDTYAYDLTVVLNLHDEAPYLERTWQSLGEACRFARHKGLKIEIVAVLDRGDDRTRRWLERRGFEDADAFRLIEVDHGSLGLSRNSGIDVARGEYVSLADADDLISYNMLWSSVKVLRSDPTRKTIVVPEYLFAFGTSQHIWKYFGSNSVNRLSFFDTHPYVSRITAHINIFKTQKFVDLRLSAGYAYEDWQFNAEALSRGCRFSIAPDTILYYRQRSSSLLRKARRLSANMTGWSSYLEPSRFIEICTDDVGKPSRASDEALSSSVLTRRFSVSSLLRDLTTAAGYIDPAINLVSLENISFDHNIPVDYRAGSCYFGACQTITHKIYTDVVLMPFLAAAGGERYIIDFLNAVRSSHPDSRFLVLLGERADQRFWTERFPSGTDFIDLFDLSGGDRHIINLVTMRILQHLAGARIFIKESMYAHQFISHYGSLLTNSNIVFFRFCDRTFQCSGRPAQFGYGFDFISSNLDRFSLLITDNRTIRAHDLERLDLLSDRYACLYARCIVSPVARSEEARTSGKLLWASRLDPQKRPDLLPQIAAGLAQAGVNVHIDVYGTSVLGAFEIARLTETPGIDYVSEFDDFYALDLQQYDALLYTSHFDGLPNIVLEALSSGMPVIAPNVGGVAEVVSRDVGALIEHSADDRVMVRSYVDAIIDLYRPETDWHALRTNAVRRIQERHSPEEYSANAARIIEAAFGPPPSKALFEETT